MSEQTEKLIQDGIDFSNQQDWEKTRTTFEEVLSLEPENREANAFLGSALVDLGNHEAALDKFEKAGNVDTTKQYPYGEWGIVLNNWGRALLQVGKWDEAIEKFSKAIEYDSYNQDIYFRNWGLALENQGQYEEAIKKYEKSIENKPDYVDAYKNLVNNYLFLQNKFEISIPYLEKLIDLDPEKRSGYSSLLGYVYEQSGRITDAAEQYRKAVAADPKFFEAYNDWGRMLLEEGKQAEALEKFDKALEIDPTYKYAYYNKARVFEGQERYEEAADQYAKAVNVDPAYAAAYNPWGRMLLRLKKYDEAIEKFKKAIELDPYNEFIYHRNWGLTLENQTDNADRFTQAMEQYELSAKAMPEYVDAHNDWGRMLVELTRYDEAEQQFKRTLELDPAYKYAYYNLGRLYEKKGNFTGAAEYYEKAANADPQYVDAYNDWGRMLIELQMYDKAGECFQKALSIDPAYSYAYYNLGRIYELQFSFDKAAMQYGKAAEVNPSYIHAYNDWGRMLMELKRHDEAEQKFKKAIEIDPSYKYAYYNLGWAFESRKNYPEAEAQYGKALEIDPNYIAVYNDWGNMLLQLGKNSEAIEKFKQALAIDPNYKYSYLNWGIALKNLGDYDGAIDTYKKAIAIDPAYGNAYFNLAQVLELQEDRPDRFEEAAGQYEKAFQSNPKDYEACSEWGRVLIELGNYDSAIEKFELAVQINPKYPFAYYHWGRALEKKSAYVEASKKYQAAVKIEPGFVEAYEAWGLLLLLYLRQYSEAEEKLNKLTESNNDVYVYLAYLRERQGDYVRLQENLRKSLEVYKGLKDKNEAQWNYLSQKYLYFQDYDKSARTIEEGLKIYPENLDLLMTKLDINLALREKYSYESPDRPALIPSIQRELNEVSQKARTILFKKLENASGDIGRKADIYMRLAELYYKMQNYDDAEAKFKEALQLDNTLAIAYSYLGVISTQKGRYEEAIQYLKEALKFEPNDFSMISNLGEVYLRSGKLEQAEVEYQTVLRPAPTHMDSLIGLAQTYMVMGDAARDKSRATDAEELYARAIELYSTALELAENQRSGMDESRWRKLYYEGARMFSRQSTGARASKLLNSGELNAVYYLRGYAYVARYDVQSQTGKDDSLLENARSDFSKLPRNDPNYYKANRTVAKIDERLSPIRVVEQGLGKWAVFALAAVVFLLMQFAFFIGRPTFKEPVYALDQKAVDVLINEKAPSEVLTGIQKVTGQDFASKDELLAAVKENIGEEALKKYSKDLALDQVEGVKPLVFEPIDGGYYALMTFGSLIFMIAGLYLQQISRLKFAGIEIEKNAASAIQSFSALSVEKSAPKSIFDMSTTFSGVSQILSIGFKKSEARNIEKEATSEKEAGITEQKMVEPSKPIKKKDLGKLEVRDVISSKEAGAKL